MSCRGMLSPVLGVLFARLLLTDTDLPPWAFARAQCLFPEERQPLPWEWGEHQRVLLCPSLLKKMIAVIKVALELF